MTAHKNSFPRQVRPINQTGRERELSKQHRGHSRVETGKTNLDDMVNCLLSHALEGAERRIPVQLEDRKLVALLQPAW